jgi:hypothetical protein
MSDAPSKNIVRVYGALETGDEHLLYSGESAIQAMNEYKQGGYVTKRIERYTLAGEVTIQELGGLAIDEMGTV